MEHPDVPHLLGLLFVMMGAAKLLGHLAQMVGQPSVLGELLAGVVVGSSVLGMVDPSIEVLHAFGELGVLILLFSIGLETDLQSLLKVGSASAAVAICGVALPFAMGYAAARTMGLPNLAAIVIGATLTATSVGITARVLSDLGRLKTPEGQVILGAAILDDVIGLVILSVIAGMTSGQSVSLGMVAKTTATAFGFLAITVLVGRMVVPPLVNWSRHVDLPGTPMILALMLAFGLGWLADRVGSAPILGAFAAGLLMVGTPRFHDVEMGVTRLGHFFVPLFFVIVGAAVDVTLLNPLDPVNHNTLFMALILTVVAVAGKFLAGYAAFWFKGSKSVIGAGMIPRGEVGLIFASMGKAGGILDEEMFAAVTVVVMVTTFIAPPLLKFLAPPLEGPAPVGDHEGIENLATEG